jgi:hypothetical protein
MKTTTLAAGGWWLLVSSCPCFFDPQYRRQYTVVDNNHPQRLRLANVHMQTK